MRDLALLIKRLIGFEGEIRFNPNMPDGMPRKLLDISRLAGLGWKATTSLEEGIAATYRAFLSDEVKIK
ncbi:MAG: hypothetical protein FJ118_15740 [Deltaproteobacteria bacterium]|nr:hypothetical protein [Deltaproteobacteria bacterium]